jgi:hypothetical protein
MLARTVAVKMTNRTKQCASIPKAARQQSARFQRFG